MFPLFSGSRARRRIGLTGARWAACAALVISASAALAQVDVYEANVFPEDDCCWQLLGAQNTERRIENGWFIQTAAPGEQASYREDVHHFAWYGDSFFVEWRAITDNPEWLIDEYQIPAALAAAGNGPLYHTVMTASAVALSRLYVPRMVVPISIDKPHTYRVEIFPEDYVWYIDGVVVDSGVPEGPYPDPNAFIVWGVTGDDRVERATTAFDYIRYGIVPPQGTGDYDNDGQANFLDTYFMADCLAKEGPDLFGGPQASNDPGAGPGCAWMDSNFDGDADLQDFAAFQNTFVYLDPCKLWPPCPPDS